MSELTAKLNNEIKEANDDFCKVILEYIIKRCEEDNGLAEDVLQPHKTWKRCVEYLMDQAKDYAKKGARSVAVQGEVVYEWAEDYYRLDDKDEVEAEEKKKAESEKKSTEIKKKAEKKTEKKSTKSDSAKAAQERLKARTTNKPTSKPAETNDYEQLSLF